MTPKVVCGLILMTAVAVAGPWPFSKKSKEGNQSKPAAASTEARQGFDSQYVSGTIAAIPHYSSGKLDLSDKSKLQFHYGKPTWSLPYTHISAIEVADKAPNPLIRVPGLSKKKRTISIDFDNDKGVRHNLKLELPLEVALEALPLLEERSGKAATVEGAQSPDGWWGDRYWKTASNQQVWDEANGKANRPAVARAQE